MQAHTLVVDDDPQIREMLPADEVIDLLILDLRLARKDGREIVRTLRDSSARPVTRAYRFAGFELNLQTRHLKRCDGPDIELTNGEFSLLAALLASPQKFFTRDQILEASRVYDNEVYNRSIDVQLVRLRRKIEADPRRPQLIVTEPGVCYAFISKVEVLY